MQNLEATKRIVQVIDLESINSSLDRFYQGYTDSKMSENDDHEQRKTFSNDYFNLKRLLKSLEDDQD